MKSSSRTKGGWLAAFFAVVGAVLSAPASALTVTNNQDNATATPLIAGSLRWAIANTPANGLVSFSNSLKGQTISLKSGQLVVNKLLTIQGLGSGSLTVSGNNTSRVFFVSGTGTPSNPTGVIISDMTITGGNGVGPDLSGFGNDDHGGAIHNVGTLQLVRLVVTGNVANLGSGGGIYNRGTLSSMIESTVSSNNAAFNGGGIFDEQDMAVVRCTVHSNIAGADGGGVQEAGTANFINSTIANNRANGSGGGINDPGGATIRTYNVTIAGNIAATGGGMANVPVIGASWELRNTIVADNSAPVGPDVSNGFGAQISQGFNLIENPAGAAPGSFRPSDQVGVDPMLGPLQDNGGPTRTMALPAGSPAIDRGSNSNLLPDMTTDQRGIVPRIVNGGLSATVDVGAYEFTPGKVKGAKGNNGLGNGGDPAPPGLNKNGKGDFNDGYLSP